MEDYLEEHSRVCQGDGLCGMLGLKDVNVVYKEWKSSKGKETSEPSLFDDSTSET
jgi:hypothetical protein